MTNRNKFAVKTAAFVGALGAMSFGGVALAETPADQPSSEELMRQIQSLQEKVDALEVEQDTTVQQLDQAAVDAAVERVLDDAEKRSEMLSMQGFTAGHNGDNFTLTSGDGAFVMNPFVQMQFRYVFNIADGDQDFQDDVFDVGFDDTDFERFDDGFELRRTKFGLKGNVFTEKLEYKFQWASDRVGGDLVLEDAWIIYEFADNWAFRAGQWKDNVFLEENVSSSRQMAADRSLINELLGGGITDRVQGGSLIYTSDAVRAEVAYHDGANSDNTSYLRGGAAEYGASGRVEFMAMGDSWDPAEDFSQIAGHGGDTDFLMFGGGVEFSDFAHEWILLHTADVLWKPGDKFSVFGAYYGQLLETGDDTVYNGGLELLVAYAINEKLDIFGRGSISIFDIDELNDINQSDDLDDDVYEITFGGNYYFVDHQAKVTIDATWLPEGTPAAESGLGIAGTGDDEVVIRGQFQLLL